MDSMRNLHTSLPSTSSLRKVPPEQLLQAFRTAALTVTNLYKTAASELTRAHSDGYQEALEDLLHFLDKENLGLGDGEGWRVRQWATERHQSSAAGPTVSDSDEDAEEEKRARSSSPVLQRKPSPEVPLRQEQTAETVARPDSAPPASPEVARRTVPTDTPPTQAEFSFRSPLVYPSHQDLDMESPEHASVNSIPQAPTVRYEVHARHSRPSARHNSLASRTGNRTNGSLGSLGSGAGIKRRPAFGDYFDIGGFGFGNGKEGQGGGGKRSRHA